MLLKDKLDNTLRTFIEHVASRDLSIEGASLSCKQFNMYNIYVGSLVNIDVREIKRKDLERVIARRTRTALKRVIRRIDKCF